MQLSDRVELVEDDQISARFPAQRYARVIIHTLEKKRYDSGEVEARWDAAAPPSDRELLDKFHWLAREVLPDDRAGKLAKTSWECQDLTEAPELLNLIIQPA